MQTGDIVFFRSSGWISRIISRLTKSDYTHVAIALDNKRVLEANRFIKSRVVELDIDVDIHSIYRIEGLNSQQALDIYANIRMYEGYSYDYVQITKWFFQLAFKYELPLVNKANKLFCSEMIDYILYNAGVPRKPLYPLGDLVPHMLLECYNMKKIW